MTSHNQRLVSSLPFNAQWRSSLFRRIETVLGQSTPPGQAEALAGFLKNVMKHFHEYPDSNGKITFISCPTEKKVRFDLTHFTEYEEGCMVNKLNNEETVAELSQYPVIVCTEKHYDNGVIMKGIWMYQ